MKETLRQDLPNGLGLSIIEVDNPIAKTHFHKRFQVALVVDNKTRLPKLKKKFRNFKKNNYIYEIKSDVTGENVRVGEVLYHEKQICDKSYEECTTELMEYLSLYNSTSNFKKEMKKLFLW